MCLSGVVRQYIEQGVNENELSIPERRGSMSCFFTSLSFSQAIALVQTEISIATSRWIAVPFCKVIHGP